MYAFYIKVHGHGQADTCQSQLLAMSWGGSAQRVRGRKHTQHNRAIYHALIGEQDVAALLETEAVRCVFIQENPAYDGLRASLGLRASAAAPLLPHGVLAVAQPDAQARSF